MRSPLSVISAAALLFCTSACAEDRREERLAIAGANPSLETLLKVADPDVGARKFGVCAACHRSSIGAPDAGGPNLYGVYGRPMGSNSARFAYTAALKEKGGQWDAATLDRWLESPRRLIPGTSMQFAGVADPLDRADIIAFLERQSD